MATKTLTGISALIKTKLESLVDGSSNALIASVLEEPRGEKVNYPCAEIMPTGGSTVRRIAMGGLNSRTFTFKIYLYQEQSEQGKTSEGANDRLKSVCDAIIHAFDVDPDLGNEIENCMLAKMDYNFTGGREAGPFATFELECDIIVPNYEIP